MWYNHIIDFIELQSMITEYTSTLNVVATRKWINEDGIIFKRRRLDTSPDKTNQSNEFVAMQHDTPNPPIIILGIYRRADIVNQILILKDTLDIHDGN